MIHLTERERRLGLHLSLEVVGQDARGTPFIQSTRTLNVSAGGLCFESSRTLPVGARLELHIHLPPLLRRHFDGRSVYRVRAVVCRLERFEGSPQARIGVRFLGEAPAA
jgi:PilZ domain-containing protein